MENKQTAVEWFAVMTSKLGYVSADILKQAKEMEKEQIKDAYEQGDIQIVNGEQYYEQTYGGNNE